MDVFTSSDASGYRVSLCACFQNEYIVIDERKRTKFIVYWGSNSHSKMC